MSAQNSRASFVATFCERMLENSEATDLVESVGSCGHCWSDMLPKISQIMFNVMGKNFSAKMNEDIRLASKKRETAKQTSVERKVAKLQSNSTQ